MSLEKFIPTLPSLLTTQGQPFIHRDLSWLQFNERVLLEALTTSNPLLERMKFLGITASNLDEFFQIRFASLGKKILTLQKTKPEDALAFVKIRDTLIEEAVRFGVSQNETLDILCSELDAVGIRVATDIDEEDPEFEIGRGVFLSHIFSQLPAPEAFTPAKLALLENLETAAIVKDQLWIRIPRSLPPVFLVRGRDGYDSKLYLFFLDDLVMDHLGAALGLPGEAGVVRVTRDGDFTLELELGEDSESVPDRVRSATRARDRGRPVRMQYRGEISESVALYALSGLKLGYGQIFSSPVSLALNGLTSMAATLSVDRPELTYPPLKNLIPKRLERAKEVFEELKGGDILLQHPYDSFDSYAKWLEAAVSDPKVKSIQQTVYRMDTASDVIELLKKAAKKKRVRVMIELRARFDELNNVRVAEELRKAGAEVAFGFGKLKLHAKVALLSREEKGELRHYTHLSTGNYNAKTARQYVDLAILTANPDFGIDASTFFDSVFQGKVPTQFKQLVPAPTALHKRILSLIQAEIEGAKAGHPARIVAKTNALVEDSLVQHLYRASQAGVSIDLIVRGACSLIPGVKGLSENIRVISVVDRFLEHSRLYYFAHSKRMYLSSADLMQRNFFSRLELAFPIVDERIYKYLAHVMIPAYLGDTVKGRELTAQGTWKRRNAVAVRSELKAYENPLFDGKPIRSQFFFTGLAERGYQDTPLEVKE
jgi:polyphosphate kinase